MQVPSFARQGDCSRRAAERTAAALSDVYGYQSPIRHDGTAALQRGDGRSPSRHSSSSSRGTVEVGARGQLELSFASAAHRPLPTPNSVVGYPSNEQQTHDLPQARSAVSRRDILTNWRNRLPFVVPITQPGLDSCDSMFHHSVVLRSARDGGVRVVSLRPRPQAETIPLDIERGILGMSLRKHTIDFLMSAVDTYPGIAH